MAFLKRRKLYSASPLQPQQRLQRFWRSLNPRRWTWKGVLKTIGVAVGAFVLLALILFVWYFKDLPKPGELRTIKASESTILYDRNGKQIYDISGDTRRILLTNNDIPKLAKEATISTEDPDFYHHHGVDFRGLARAIIFLGTKGGGSTIDQQYIKNAVLSPDRSIVRKIKEIILALELDLTYSKDDILTLYLNEIPYGGNIYGIEAASQSYYGKSVKDGLSLAQIATLAALPQSPTYYSPYGNNVDALIARKNFVLDNMVKAGYISQADADKAKQEAPLTAKDFAEPKENFPAPHFVMYVRQQLVDKYGETAVQRGGLRVTTSLDLDLQKDAEQAVSDNIKTLKAANASNAALVAMDPKTGQILAMVGSVDYFDSAHQGNFNVATALRQPGSAGKPIVYATLFSNSGYAPGSMLWDVQTDFGGGYKPNNFDTKFHGPISIRKALGNSFNVPAVKALAIEGLPAFLDNAKKMGITTFDGKQDQFGLSVALGGGEVKLVDLVSAYTVFANNGDKAPTVSILKVQDSTGKTLDEWKVSQTNVLKPEVAYEINSILSDTDAKLPTFGGLISVLSVSGKTTAVKTGTTDNYKDAWTIGYTPSLVAGVWAGNNNNTEMNHGGGSTVAAPLWHSFMVKALQGKKDEGFYRPSDISDVTFDFISGGKPTPASGQLAKDIFAPWQVPTKDDNVHQALNVCKANGKLATDTTPADQVEQRVFGVAHSEMPNNANWENPVQAWIKSSNLFAAPPTDKCDITLTNPTIAITDPSANQAVSGVFTVATDVKLPAGQTGSVDFSVDGTLLSTDSSDPFTATIDTKTLSQGNHDISATVHASGGGSATTKVTVSVQKDVTPPADVTNVTLLPGNKGTATASWHNPGDSDLASVVIYVSQTAGVKGSKFATITANPATDQSSTLTGLVSAVPNYITFDTVDNSGNESQTTKQYPVTPL